MRKLLFLLLLSFPALAQTPGYVPIPSTNDLSVSSGASITYDLGQWADYVWIRNHCSDALQFDLRGEENFTVRLGQNEVFEGPFRVRSVKASNDGASTCEFSLQGGKR